MKNISTLLAASTVAYFLLIIQAPSADAHGYLSVPRSRNLVAHQRKTNRNYEPQSLSSGQRRNSPLVYPETEAGALGHGLCGDAPRTKSPECWNGGDCPEQAHMPGGKFYTKGNGNGGLIQATYSEGQTIDVEMYIMAHHMGAVTLRLCDEARVTEKCLNKYGPLKRVDFEQGGLREAQPINPNHPEFWYLNPTAYAPAKVPGTTHYRMRARFKLPEGVSCENCVLQWWWITGNSCTAPGYDDNMKFPAKYRNGFFKEGLKNSKCVGTTVAEEFWNCADIAIKKDKNPQPVTATTTTAPPPVRTTTTPAPVSTTTTKVAPTTTTTSAAATVTTTTTPAAAPDGVVLESCVSFEAVDAESGHCSGFLSAAAKHLRVQVKDIQSFGHVGKVWGNVPVCEPGADGTYASAQNKGLWAKVMYRVCAAAMGPCKRRYLRGN
jgi:hypothetical protein